MTQPSSLPARTTASTVAEHVDDHVALHQFYTEHGGISGNWVFGPGHDGALTLDPAASGSVTLNGIANSLNRSNAAYVATRDLYFTDLTLLAGAELRMSGYKLFVSGTATIPATAVIQHDGLSAATAGGFSAANGLAQGFSVFDFQAWGGSDGGGTAGAAGGAVTQTAAIIGGVGGASGGGQAGGTVAAATGFKSILPRLPWFSTPVRNNGSGVSIFVLSAGGSGGGSAANSAGGGGGGGGGWMTFAARKIINNGRVSCNGGNGFPGALNAGTGAGGGGGGGGGLLVVVSASRTGSGTYVANGGSGAAGVGTGLAGAAGQAGIVSLLDV